MSFPNIIYGDYGDEKVISATKIGNLPLGQRMVLPDGRIFAHALSTSGSTLSAGKLCIQPAGVADHGNVAASGLVTASTSVQTVAIGNTSIILTVGATTVITKDQYADGFLTLQSSTGAGVVYKVASHAAATLSATVTINLAEGDAIAATIAAGTTTAGLRGNVYSGVTIRAAGSTAVGVPVGVPPMAVLASRYFWIQTRGTCSGLAGGSTIVTGDAVVAGSVEAGSFVPHAAAATTEFNWHPLGFAQNTVTAASYGTIFLTID